MFGCHRSAPKGGSENSAPVVETYILAGFLFWLSVFCFTFNVLLAD